MDGRIKKESDDTGSSHQSEKSSSISSGAIFCLSRRSTHKRQKQYFEQRKRQQQQETASSGKLSCTQHCENNRSLDILSLVNVSTVAQGQSTSSHNARDNSEDDDFTLNDQFTHPPPVIGIPVDQSELNEERTWSYHTEAEYIKNLPDHIEDLDRNGDKLDHVKLSTTHEISVVDLLGDGGTNSNALENSVHAQEAHVAFSVEGLGEVDTETPVHSPEIQRRSFPVGSSSPKKSRRQPMAFKNLDNGFDDFVSPMDVMMEGTDFSPNDNSIKQPFLSRGVKNFVGDPDQKFFSFRKTSPFNWNSSPLQGDCGNDELFYGIRDSGRNIWNGPCFLDDNTDDLGGYKSFGENWVDQSNVVYDDYFHIKDLWKQDFNFEDRNLQKKRSSTRETVNFNMTESPAPYLNHQIMEDLPDALISDTRWYSTVGIDNDVKDAVNYFVREDTRESLSRLSEESCSSTAVWGDATKKSGENRT